MTGAHRQADRAATPSEPSPEGVSGVAGIPCAAPIVHKLLAVESAAPDFIGGNDGGCHTCFHRNPDGPEAAEIIRALYEAVEICLAMAERALKGSMNLKGQSPYDIGIAALRRARGEAA